MLGPQIIPYFPHHDQYIEVFGGSMSLLFQKIPSDSEIYNDINDRLVNFWKVLKDQPYDLILECQRIGGLDSHKLFEEYKNPSEDRLEDAARFLYINKMSFSRKMDTYHGKDSSGNKAKRSFDNILLQLESISQRLQLVSIESQDFRTIFNRFDDPDSFFYVDPPYVQGGDQYEKIPGGETWADHDLTECLEICKHLKAKCLISLDKRELCPEGFYTVPISRINFCDQPKESRNRVEEYLFMNYDPKKIVQPVVKGQRRLF